MKNEGYTRVNWTTAKKLDIKGNDLLIYCLIESLSRSNKGWMQFNYKRMAEVYNISERCAINSVQNLLKRKLIEKIGGKGVSANRYRPVASAEEISSLSEDATENKFSSSSEEYSLQSGTKFSASTEKNSPKNKETEIKHNKFKENTDGFFTL